MKYLWFLPKVTKIYLNLLKLCIANLTVFFHDSLCKCVVLIDWLIDTIDWTLVELDWRLRCWGHCWRWCCYLTILPSSFLLQCLRLDGIINDLLGPPVSIMQPQPLCFAAVYFFSFFLQRKISGVSRPIAAKLWHMIGNGGNFKNYVQN